MVSNSCSTALIHKQEQAYILFGELPIIYTVLLFAHQWRCLGIVNWTEILSQKSTSKHNKIGYWINSKWPNDKST